MSISGIYVYVKYIPKILTQDFLDVNLWFVRNKNKIRLTLTFCLFLLKLRGVSDSLSYDQDIGSECMFLSAFMIAFFFNWIGFFASICLLPNAAGKYGALSGFGLSMAKWVTIVRVSALFLDMVFSHTFPYPSVICCFFTHTVMPW